MAVVTAAVPVLVYYGVAFIRGKVVELIQRIDNDLVETTLEKAMEIVMNAVLAVSQTFVDTLKQHGQFTPEAQREAFDRAKAYVLTLMSAEVRELLTEIYGNLDVWLETMIEATVSSVKAAEKARAGDPQASA